MRSSRWIASALGGCLIAAGLLACDAILGIDERPLRRAPEDAGAVVDAGDASDATSCDPTGPNATSGCAASCPHDLCRDFDVAGQTPEQGWTSPVGFTNPLLKGDASIEVAAPGISPPQAMHVVTGSTSSSSFAMLGEQVRFSVNHSAETFEGIHVSAYVRIDKLSFDGAGGCPLDDAGCAAVLGLLRPAVTATPKGIALLAADTGFFINVSDDVLGGNGENVLANLGVKLSLASVFGNPTRVEIFVGTPTRAATVGFTNCPTSSESGLVAAALVGGGTLGSACVAIPASFDMPAAARSWAEAPVLLVGGLLFGPGTGEFRVDNVVADFYGK